MSGRPWLAISRNAALEPPRRPVLRPRTGRIDARVRAVRRTGVGAVRYNSGVTDPGEQMALVRAEAARGRARAAGPGASAQPAESEPVARVIVDVEPAHLDRLWDYAVPAKLHETARPGMAAHGE